MRVQQLFGSLAERSPEIFLVEPQDVRILVALADRLVLVF